MTQEFKQYLKDIDSLQGLIYQNLMEAFNDLNELVNTDFSDVGNIASVQQMKHAILARLKSATNYINSPRFKVACITCSAVRLFGLLKYTICSKYLTEQDVTSVLGEVITDYKIDKKYTEHFFSVTNEIKGSITKFISSQSLRKQFILDNFCLKYLSNEVKKIQEAFPENKINIPDWMDNLSESDFKELTSQALELVKNKDYENFAKFMNDK